MLFNRSDKDIVISGHRGYRVKYPENTMLSFKKAIELGVDQLETDVHLTKDNKLILMHDATVDRTTDGTGAIGEKTLKEMLELDAGIFKGEEFRGLRVPTLEEFLDFLNTFHPEISINVEIKDYRRECVDATVKMLREYGFDGRFVIAAWDASIVEYARREHGVRTQGFPKEIYDNYREGSFDLVDCIGIPLRMLTPELVAEYNAMGIEPHAWCPDDEESVRKCVACGARLICCNDPVPALKVLGDLGLRVKK